MQKRKLCLTVLAFLLGTLFLQGGLTCAQEKYNNFTAQYFLTDTSNNLVFFEQGISGLVVPEFRDGGQVSVNFNNFTVNGLYNASYGIGSFRNQGSLALVNIQPNQVLAPPVFIGTSFSENNKVDFKDFNYSVSLNFNGFRGSGIVVLNLMAGSFSNQFTSVHFSMGKNMVPPSSPTTLQLSLGNDSTLVALTNSQMQAVAATSNNDIQIQGKQNAVATVQGAPEVQGICAITLSSGVNNLVIHRVGVNIETGR